MFTVRRPLLARLEAHTVKTDTCWLWQGSTSGGYGKVFIERGRPPGQAHRLMYECLIGPIPDGLQLDHLCRVRHCVNPSHLQPVTHRTNMDRAVTARTHCKRGHEFTPENTYNAKNARGGVSRVCIACRTERTHAHS